MRRHSADVNSRHQRDSHEFPILIREVPYGLRAAAEIPPTMLDFRGHRGNSFGLPYRDLVSIAHYPGDNVTIEFQGHIVVIRGRNLHTIYDAIMLHEVTFVQEDRFDGAGENETFVDSITVNRKDKLG